MPRVQYLYTTLQGEISPHPMAVAVAVNIRNQKTANFIGILDTGADSVTLSSDLIDRLGIDSRDLGLANVGGVHGFRELPSCHFIEIAIVELPAISFHFPNGDHPVPVHFANGPLNLLGRQSFLNLCKATFDGPNQLVTIDI